ncbi:MAG: synthase subunit [Chloroflexi bacterium]|nr:synthase subunit [Chloroflexota bacterium]
MEPILKSLGVDLPSVAWHLINFLILIWILQRFMYRPILKMLDDRAARIRDSMAEAEAVRAETARLQTESKNILDEARSEGQTVLAQANHNAERIISEARQAAQQEADRLVERAKSELAREREQSYQELRQEVADLAIAAASRVIGRALDGPSHRELVREFLASDMDGRKS